MIIYLEGPDASGKSTLRQYLAKRLDQLKSIHEIEVIEYGEKLIPTRPTELNRIGAEQLVSKWFEMAGDITKVYLVDRGPISDIVYRTFDELLPVINLEVYWTMWLANHSLIVTVHCDTDQSKELLSVRGDDNPIAIANHAAIRYLYKQLMPMFNAYKYDVSTIKDTNDMLNATNSILARLWKGLDDYKRYKYLKVQKASIYGVGGNN